MSTFILDSSVPPYIVPPKPSSKGSMLMMRSMAIAGISADRYHIVVGLVWDDDGLPLAVEVWPGDTADKSTVIEQVR